MPIEQKLAILDAGTFVDVSDMKVVAMKKLLADLSLKFSEPKDTIAEYTSKAQGVLQKDGIKENCQDIMEEMDKAEADKVQNTPYSSAIILYLMLREKQ